MQTFVKTVIFFFVAGTLLMFPSCDPENVIGIPDNGKDTTDYIWKEKDVIHIELSGSTIECASSNVRIEGSTATILKGGTYQLNGNLNNGQIVVDASALVRLLLNNVQITNANNTAIYLNNTKRTIIMLLEGTDNKVTDGADYVITPDSLNAAIYSHDYLAIAGKGKLTVQGNYNGGIYSRDEIIIESGEIVVNSVGGAIKGKDYLVINGGKFDITSGGDALKSDKTSNPLEGYITINGGEFKIVSEQDGMSAETDINIYDGIFNIISGGGSEFLKGESATKGIKSGKNINIHGGDFRLDCADNAIDAGHHLAINDGVFELLSSRRPLDADSTITIQGGQIKILKADKGVSAQQIAIHGGEVSVIAEDDCLKANASSTVGGSFVKITDGVVLLESEKGDAIDGDDGSVFIEGGFIVIQGSPKNADSAIRSQGSSNFFIHGGKLYAVGSNIEKPQSSSSQNTVYVSFQSVQPAEQVFSLQTATDESVALLKAKRAASVFLVSDPLLITGQSFSLYTGGQVSGTNQGGFYTDGTYSNGALKATITIAEGVTEENIVR